MHSSIAEVKIVPNPEISGIPYYIKRVKCGIPSPA